MTEEKVERLIKAFTVTGTILFVILIAVLGYQLIRIHSMKKQKSELERQIAEWETRIEQKEGDLEYYRSSTYLEQAARKHNYVFPDDIILFGDEQT